MKATQREKLITYHRIFIHFAIGVLITQITACASLNDNHASWMEGAPQIHDEGTMLVGEVVGSLTRAETMSRFSKTDLEIAGWTELDDIDDIALRIINFKQNKNPIRVYTALLQKSSTDRPQYSKTCSYGCSYGGGVVSFRVVRKPLYTTHPSGLNVVEKIIEPRDQTGDCGYGDLGPNRGRFRYSMLCNSLFAEGWDWHNHELVKIPVPNSN